MTFAIASLPAGAGTLVLCPLPVTAEARARIAALAPALVLSLTETAELRALGAADLPDWLAAHGIGWAHFPVPDFQTPPPGSDWPALSVRARAVLDSGGTLVVHCRGGCGRSGMIALRLLIEGGEAADPALSRLRQARPCAIETDAQHLWATAPSSCRKYARGGLGGDP
ncbi:MAG: protein phosphatase [Rhodobacteraceae bacterium]|nr:protein phosphatase [Paracoccaceae bacterium]